MTWRTLPTAKTWRKPVADVHSAAPVAETSRPPAPAVPISALPSAGPNPPDPPAVGGELSLLCGSPPSDDLEVPEFLRRKRA